MPRSVLLLLAVVAAGALMIHVCASGGGMGAAYATCDCLGIEWELYDRRPADGPRKTICLGIVRARTCYRFEGGPAVACPR